MGDARLTCINPKNIDDILPHISRLLDRALEKSSTVTLERTLEELRAGTFQLWVVTREAVEALAVTQLTEEKVCVVILCAGDDRARWVHFIEQIENFARAEGCVAVRIYGRVGWERVLPEYRKTRVILEKELK